MHQIKLGAAGSPPTLVLHVADDVAAHPVLGHRAGVALPGAVALGPPEHPPDLGGDVTPGQPVRRGPRPLGEPHGAEEEPLPAPRLLRAGERARAEETRGREQRQRSLGRPHGCLRPTSAVSGCSPVISLSPHREEGRLIEAPRPPVVRQIR